MDLYKQVFTKSRVRTLISSRSLLKLTKRRSVYSAGGTVLSASNYSRLDNVNYGSGVGPTAQQLIGNVSEVLDVAQLAVVSFKVTGGSAGLNSSLPLNISQHANRQLCDPESDIVGAIMLHGTDTLEETVYPAFFEFTGLVLTGSRPLLLI